MSLRVCYILPRLLLGKSGIVVGAGAANCVSLGLELGQQGVQIELLAPVPHEWLEYLSGHPLREIVRPLPIGRLGLVAKGLGAIHALRCSLKKRLQEKHFDVVHSHSGAYPYAIVPLAANHKSCVRLHSLYCPIGGEGGVYGRWWEKPTAAKFIFNRLDKVVAVTDNVRRSIEKVGVPSEKIELVPMCVDTRRFYPREHRGPRRYFPSQSNGGRILFVGNSSKEKGLAELVKAVRTLVDDGVRVFLVAAIENQSAIKEYSTRYDRVKNLIAELDLTNNVRSVGLVDHIEDLYAESDLVVIPWNTTRGPCDHPMVALEAMAMGKCVLSTPVGGCPELLRDGEAGLLTGGFSVESIARAIEFAIQNPQVRKKTGQAALETVKRFCLENSAERLIGLYERLLESKVRHRGLLHV